MSAIDRLEVKLTPQSVAGYVQRRGSKLVEVQPYKRDVFEAIIRDVARSYRARAESRDSVITPMMEALARGTGGQLSGLNNRLKGETRMRAKIEARVTEQHIPIDRANEVQLSDALRYTMVYDDADYTPGALTVLDRLEKFGFTVTSKRYWAKGDPYDGTNVALTDPTGFPIEIQFHTPASLELKTKNHPLYQEFRSIYETDRRFDPDDALRARELWIEMVNNADDVPVPPGVESIPGEIYQPFPELPGLSGNAVIQEPSDPLREPAVGLSRIYR